MPKVNNSKPPKSVSDFQLQWWEEVRSCTYEMYDEWGNDEDDESVEVEGV